MTKRKRPVDRNILDAINKLKCPLINKNGAKIFIRTKARNESGAEHISGKLHSLKIRDIELLSLTLMNPLSIKFDNRKGKLYFGRRKGINKKYQFLKIVVKEEKDGNETIVTICLAKRYN